MANFNCFSTARDIAAAIRQSKITALEVMEMHLGQIQRVNPEVNAIVSLNEELALDEAKKADEISASGRETGPLHGLPIAIKDTHNAKGFPMTNGSLALRDNISTEDDLITERLKNAGAIIIGKTNVPEFAAGAHTFNEVFGVTRNPYNLNRTAGGSSGGAAAAVASGMLPLADGNDMGGSCRYPAAFNNVVGMRTSPGRIPQYPKGALFSTLGVQGPIARNVGDAAFMLSVVAGPDSRSPISIEEPGELFLKPFNDDIKGLRIAWSADFNGLFPVDPIVRKNVKEQMKYFETLGCHVEETCPDLTEAYEVFHTYRAWELELSTREIVARHKEVLKPSFLWNVEKGRKLTAQDLGTAELLRNELYHRARNFFEQYDALILPVSQVPPFDADIEFPQKINNVEMKDYIDWMRSAYYISVLGNPALSVPSGFTPGGLPLGIQIVGPHRKDYKVMRIGYAFEQATQYGEKRPKIAQFHEEVNGSL
ncbi:amidase [Evansella sp. LMS18]|uniref:amidase n=1 Tax=Evansella sp. LMS18 TaxID=2924033 RepID=UPI0020D104CB|nr:amidase [Evansella sp. LMS18]UTR10299.1 amidase [Evansella sp. LMS18]